MGSMRFIPKILVVDDEPQMLELQREVLTRRRTEPRCVGSSREAAELIEQEKFDGVFLDWLMPDIDGLELAQKIRWSRSNSLCPIVMITGVTEREALRQCFRSGINFFLQKPVSVEQINKLLTAAWDLLLQERLRYQRVPLQVAVECQWHIQDFRQKGKGKMVNLSTTGMLVKLDPAPTPTTLVYLRFRLPGDSQPLALNAYVVRTAPGQQVGLRLVNLTPEERWCLMEFSRSALGFETESTVP